MNIPVLSLDENELYKYEPNSGFYTDNCFPYTTENGTDIFLNDRKKEFNDKNLSLCQNNCSYVRYDSKNKKSNCDCITQNKMDIISNIIDVPDILSNHLDTDETSSSSISSNIITIKCTKILFSKDGLLTNISSYILIIFIVQHLLSIMLFIKCGYNLLENDIQDILSEKQKMKKQNPINNLLTSRRSVSNKKKKKKFGKKIKMNFPPKMNNLIKEKKTNHINIKNNIKVSSRMKVATLNNNIKGKINKNSINLNNPNDSKKKNDSNQKLENQIIKIKNYLIIISN